MNAKTDTAQHWMMFGRVSCEEAHQPFNSFAHAPGPFLHVEGQEVEAVRAGTMGQCSPASTCSHYADCDRQAIVVSVAQTAGDSRPLVRIRPLQDFSGESGANPATPGLSAVA